MNNNESQMSMSVISENHGNHEPDTISHQEVPNHDLTVGGSGINGDIHNHFNLEGGGGGNGGGMS